MADWGPQLIELHLSRLKDMHTRSIEALRQMGDDDVNWKPNPESNSTVNLAIHIAASLWSVAARGGGKQGTLDRSAEFGAHEPRTRDEMISILEPAFGAAEEALAGLSPERLGEMVEMYGREVTVLEAMFRGVAHVNEHSGQILYIAKLRLGPNYQVQRGKPRK
ncbi:MAG: DUF1572 family protein [Symbiobacteriia bacterium]